MISSRSGLSVWLGSYRGGELLTPQPLGQPLWPAAMRSLRREQFSLPSRCLVHPGAGGMDECRTHGGGPVLRQEEHRDFSSLHGSGDVCSVSSKSSEKEGKNEVLSHYYVMDTRQNYRHTHTHTI